MRYSNCFRVVFATMAVACGFIAIPGQRLPQNFPLQINGQVRYAESNMPAANVLVRVESISGGLAGQTVTDRSGKFSFTGLRGEQYTVTVHAPGYNDIQENIDLMTANTGYMNASLVRDRSVSVNKATDMTVGTSPAVFDVNVPLEAQNEYTKAKVLIDKGKNGNINEGIQHLESAIAIYPKFYAAQLMLGLAHMDLKQWEKAEEALLSAIEMKSDDSTAHFALGEVYRRLKKYPEGEKALLRGMELNVNLAEGHAALAKLYWDMAPTTADEGKFSSNLENSWKEASKP